jgi:acetyl-CoA synthetase
MADRFTWTPRTEHLTRSNAARFMLHHGIGDAAELTRRSIDEPDWFWDAVVRFVGIEFFEPYQAVRDAARGPAWTRWFVGGRLNVAHNCVDRHARSGHGGHPALIAECEDGSTQTWSYDQLLEETRRLAGLLDRAGVGRGDRVGLLLPMVPEAVAAFFAVARIGAVVVPIFSGFGADAVAKRLDDAGAVALCVADGAMRKGRIHPMKDIADAALARCPSVRHAIVLRHAGNPVAWRDGFDIDWQEPLADETERPDCVAMDAEDPFLIAYTSGTTGRPKGAVHVHGGFLVKIAQEVAFQADMTPDDRLFWLTDLGWIMGPWELVGGLASGGTVVLYDGAPDVPDAGRLWRLVERHRASILGVSPTLVRALMRHGEEPVRAADLSSLRILASTGEPWNPDPWLWYFHNVGGGRLPIINISGGTEVGACFLSPLPVTPLKPCTLGGPALGTDIDVVDAHGTPLRGGVGELICRNSWPSMTRGLWNDPDRYINTYWSRFEGVWTHGDWASIDEDGLWFLHGRSDDTLNIAGKRIGPAEVESILVAHPDVAEAAAIGVPHEVKGEALWCFVVPRPGASVDDALIDALRSVVVEALGKAFAPEQVRFVAELPRTRNAKILRRALRARVLGSDPGDLSNLENPGALDAIEPAR